MQNRRAAYMYQVYSDEQRLTAQISYLENAPHNEKNAALISSLRKERADLIARNISRY